MEASNPSTLENIHVFPGARSAHLFAIELADAGHQVDARQLTIHESRVYVDDAIRFAKGFQLFTNVSTEQPVKRAA